MARAFLFVLDSFGIGGAADAERYGDTGSNTFAHIARACAEGRADREGLRTGPLLVPNMLALGLGQAAATATGFRFENAGSAPLAAAFHGAAQEVSSGKDTPSGHWEIAGLPVRFDWGYFPDTIPAFPAELTEAMVREGKVPGILGNCHAPGTEIIERFGEDHIRTGQPICYTSIDSVLQIAAHEVHFGLERLYDFCKVVRRLVANFVDFDTEFGHRRDVAGYAAALEAFDRRLPEAFARLRPGDLLILTADHGNDPTWRGTDHTRERIPVIGTRPGFKGADIGLR
ncbi:MAG: hypothetical protein E5V36_07340, partial [Mesorhizobium sp.]